uniref:nucleoside phosphorylase n=1 Tax=Ndongobacter massiliensis TaxID=1871025 RepID=UPI001E450573|nr:nucleoside phosphorylase [Ndongobacter massiliensis]
MEKKMENKGDLTLNSIHVPDSLGVRYAILPGDPERVLTIAKFLENARPVSVHREYTSYVGEIDGEPVLAISTGMGGPSTAICVEELYAIGVKTVIRLGTCGGMQEEIEAGDRVVVSGAIRQEGTTNQYVYPEFPAVADLDVVQALREASARESGNTWVGVVQSKDSLYGQHAPQRMPVAEDLEARYRAWIKAGCLGSEMEASTVFIVSQIRKMRAGCLLNVIWNKEREKAGFPAQVSSDMTASIRAVVEAIRILIRKDRENSGIADEK